MEIALMFVSPIIIFLTFRVNKVNARVDQDQERERKRELEIQDAKKARAERFAQALAMTVQNSGKLTL